MGGDQGGVDAGCDEGLELGSGCELERGEEGGVGQGGGVGCSSGEERGGDAQQGQLP